jgi:hypothetical protein
MKGIVTRMMKRGAGAGCAMRLRRYLYVRDLLRSVAISQD